MPEGCDAACEKIIIDTGMAVLAALEMYAPSLDHAGITGSARNVVGFYVKSVDLFTKQAQKLNAIPLRGERHARLMAQIQEMCYRAAHLVAWSLESDDEIRENAASWRDAILVWAKNDQEVFTALVMESD